MLGIYGFGDQGLLQFLQITFRYFETKRIRTQQTKAAYVLLQTSLFYEIKRIQALSRPMLQQPLTGTIVFKNLEIEKNYEILVHDLEKSINQPARILSTFQAVEPKIEKLITSSSPTFLTIGEYAGICGTNIIIFTTIRSIEQQLRAIPLLNFVNKRYYIFLMDQDSIDHIQKQETVESIQKQIKDFFLERNLHIVGQIRISPFSHLDFSPENDTIIQTLFHAFNEAPLILQKRANEYIFKIAALHHVHVPSNHFFARLDSHPLYESAANLRGIDIHIINHTLTTGKIVLQIFDLAGNDRWKFIAESFISNARGFYLLYDENVPESIQTVKEWIEILENKQVAAPIIILSLNSKSNSDNINHIPEHMAWLADHSKIIEYVAIPNDSQSQFELAQKLLLQRLIETNYLQPMDTSESNAIPYQTALEKLSLYQEIIMLLKQERVLGNCNQNEIETRIREYFNNISSERIRDYISSYVGAKDPLVRLFGLRMMCYFPTTFWGDLLAIMTIKENPDSREIYFMLTTLLYYYHRNWDCVIAGISKNTVNSRIQTIEQFNMVKQKLYDSVPSNPTLNLEAKKEFDIQVQILLIQLLPAFKLPNPVLRSYLLPKMVHYSPEIRETAWNQIIALGFITNKSESQKHFLRNLEIEEKSRLNEISTSQLVHKNQRIRENAIIHIGWIGLPKATKTLIISLVQKEERIRDNVCQALNELDPNHFPTSNYPEILNSFSQEERKQLLEQLKQTVYDNDEDIRFESVKILRDLHDKQNIKTLLIALDDFKESIRLIASQALIEFQNPTTIVPLLECMVTTNQPLLRKEILKGLHQIDPNRFIEPVSDTFFYDLTNIERKDFCNRIINRIQKAQDELKKVSLVRILGYFNEIEVLRFQVDLLHEPFAQIQYAARENFLFLVKQPRPNGLYETEQINLLLQALDDFTLYTRIEFTEYLQNFSRSEIVKALLFYPLTEQNRIYSVLGGLLNLNLNLLYTIQKLSLTEIFESFSQQDVNQRDLSTYTAFIGLSYPHSHEILLRYINAQNPREKANQYVRLCQLSQHLTREFSIQTLVQKELLL